MEIDLRNWVKTQYPDGNIDWKREHNRLLTVIQQVYPTFDRNLLNDVHSMAAINVLEVAVKIGEILHE